MPVWEIFLILSATCLLIGLITPKRKRSAGNSSVALATRPQVVNFSEAGSPMPNAPIMAQWNETDIARHFDDLRGQPPAVISHYIESIKRRIVVNQNDKTAVAQVRFLQTKVQELKLFKEGQQIMLDL